MYTVIRSLEDCTFLKNNLNIFVDWSLSLNISKCNIIYFVKNTKSSPVTFQYLISIIQLERVSSIGYFGIFFISDLTFNFHFHLIINKALEMLGFLNKSPFQFNNSFCLKSLYCSLV